MIVLVECESEAFEARHRAHGTEMPEPVSMRLDLSRYTAAGLLL
jgi:hypothetical protein